MKFDSSGTKTVVAPNVIASNAHGDETSHGLSLLPNGDVVFADSGENALKRITKNGAITKIIGDIPFPNGVIVDREGMVYVSLVAGSPGEKPVNPGQWEGSGSLIRVDPDTGDYDLLGEEMDLPNGLAFGPDYKTLYIYQHDRKGTLLSVNTETDEITVVKDGLGSPGGLDGRTVDECGNVYIATQGKVWRITPELEVETVMSGLGSKWIPNQHFGSGIGGWNEKSLYVIDYQQDSLYEIPLGVRGVTPPNLE